MDIIYYLCFWNVVICWLFVIFNKCIKLLELFIVNILLLGLNVKVWIFLKDWVKIDCVKFE